MIEVNTALIHKVAELSRLELSEQELIEYVKSIGDILKHVEQLNSLNTEGVEPMFYGIDGSLRLREDVVHSLDPKENGKPRILESSPEVIENGFKVPQVVG